MAFDYDLFVIGGGSGGVRAARLAGGLGYKVGLAEEYRLGGTCVIRGCVPKKLMVYASGYRETFEDATAYGWSPVQSNFDWTQFMAAKNAEIARLEGVYKGILDNNNVTHFAAHASLKDPHTVALSSGKNITAKHILIATGGQPFVPEFEGREYVIDSNTVFELPTQPKRILIVGGGYIACEFAGIFNGLGSAVTHFYRGEHILRGFDQEIADFTATQMRTKGIDLRLKTDVAHIEKKNSGLCIHTTTGNTLDVDCVFYATGRRANTNGLGLEDIGLELNRGAVPVDAFSQTKVPSIWAIGDVTNRVQLTPVAIHEGVSFIETLFKGNATRPDHALIPTAIFTQPEIGTIGLSEERAAQNGAIDVYVSQFRPMQVILTGRNEQMLLKMIVDADTQKVVGLHIVGHGAGEMIQAFGVAIKMGATKADFDATMAVHPTAGEELVTLGVPTRRVTS